MAADDVPCCETMFWVYLLVCVALVAFAGLMSGLTLGLMSLSLVELEVMIKAGEPHERKNAEKILPLVKNQHLLLCTLLIGNALAMEALPIFVDSLLPAWGAILISVTLILAFGEIIPQAICSRYGLSIGAKLSVLVRLIIIVFFPLSYPISKLLDLLLGKRHSTLLGRAELKSLVYMHGNEAGKGGELTHDETTIISGALDMSQKSAKDAMTPVSQIFSLDINSKLDEKTMGLIASEGHSGIPIYSVNPSVIIGFILVKNLIKARPEDETPIRDLPIRRMPRVDLNLPLYDILNIFQTGRSHMAAVVGTKNYTNINTPVHDKSINGTPNKEANVVLSIPVMNSSESNRQSPIRYIDTIADEDEEIIGIITLEDVVEELIQEEIFDETDRYVQLHKRITINMPISGILPETATWASELASPISPYRSNPLSPSLMISTLLRSPINSPYRHQSSFLRPTLHASPSAQPPSVLSPDSNERYYYLSPSRVLRKSYEKLSRSNGS
ncbi:CBS domain [Arabidopsis thaliana x Arabidopsis arenosa]|uniref:CBS domain n=1 Tax=Arabidopsis thaliana x Arabidopsis arenosa TaxID=1240361 RepID=A0A8T1XHF5_9BRAS|nr:CBS domain [Arabidopsis thaliana x Arabidopsis arenosa]